MKKVIIIFLLGFLLLNTGTISLLANQNQRKNTTPKAPLGTFTYKIKPGDAIYEIASRFNTTISNILAFNRIYNVNLIYPNEKITIPESPPEAIIYRIKPGDTLYKIAQKYGTQVHTIVEFNYLDNPELIYPNQKLVVPISLRGTD